MYSAPHIRCGSSLTSDSRDLDQWVEGTAQQQGTRLTYPTYPVEAYPSQTGTADTIRPAMSVIYRRSELEFLCCHLPDVSIGPTSNTSLAGWVMCGGDVHPCGRRSACRTPRPPPACCRGTCMPIMSRRRHLVTSGKVSRTSLNLCRYDLGAK